MNVPPENDISVWFSCGAASAVAAKLTLEKYGKTNTIRILNTPIKEELADNRRFLKDCEKWLGVEVEIVVSTRFPESSAALVWEKRKFMSSPYGAPCTQELKKLARQEWEVKNGYGLNSYLVMGFTADEVNRHERFVATERPNLIPVLIDAGLTKADCFRIVEDAGIELPEAYRRGYPNANCIGCVKASSPTYWNHVRSDSPEIFNDRARLSRALGARLVKVKGKRIFLDELNPDAKGRPMKKLNMPDCGIFCEEK